MKDARQRDVRQRDARQREIRQRETGARRTILSLSANPLAKRSSKRIIFGGTVLSALLIVSLLAPWLAPFDAAQTALASMNLFPGTSGHLLGTDYLGRDLFTQVVWGARASLLVGLLAAALAVAFGSVWGAVSALCGGAVDDLMMRIVDAMLSVPNIILLLALNSLVSTPGLMLALSPFVLDRLGVTSYSYGILPLLSVIVVISATSWLEAARVARGRILSIRNEDYIVAARALGVGGVRMIRTHLLPNSATVLLVEGTLLVSDAILMESGLSFLGLGLGASTPSWGSMLNSAQLSLVQGNWWAVLIPGLFITLTVCAVTLLGEGWLELLGGSGQQL